MADRVRKCLIQAGFTLLGPEGLVTSAQEADAAQAALAEKPMDLLLLFQATFADSTMALQMAEKIEAPLLLLGPTGKEDRRKAAFEFLLRINPRRPTP